MKRIDEWLLDKVFQRVADFSILTFGWDCFLLSRGCGMAFAIGMFCCACWLDDTLISRFVDFLLGAGYMASMLFAPDYLLPEGTCNIRRVSDRSSRICFLFLIVIFALTSFGFSFKMPVGAEDARQLPWDAMTAYMYFRACDPHPPVRKQEVLDAVPEAV